MTGVLWFRPNSGNTASLRHQSHSKATRRLVNAHQAKAVTLEGACDDFNAKTRREDGFQCGPDISKQLIDIAMRQNKTGHLIAIRAQAPIRSPLETNDHLPRPRAVLAHARGANHAN